MNISVIIPTLNRRSYVLDLLEDLSRQRQTVYDVIVSDQSSSHEKIKNNYPFQFTHFKHLGKGPCCSRNDAASMAKGEILVFLDDDARVMPDFIEELVSPIQKQIVEVSTGAVCNAEGNYIHEQHQYDLFKNDIHWLISFTRNPNHDVSQFSTAIPAGCMAIKKKLFHSIGGFDLFFDPNGAWEDREFALRLISNGCGIYYNARAKLFHLGEPLGGRRSLEIDNTPFSFKKNLAYVLLKHFSKYEYKNYIRSEMKFRLFRMLKLNMFFYNSNELLKFLKMTRKLKNNFNYQNLNSFFIILSTYVWISS